MQRYCITKRHLISILYDDLSFTTVDWKHFPLVNDKSITHRGRISLFKLSYGERIANLAVHHNAKEQHRTFPSYIKKKTHSKYESFIVTESNKVLNLFFFCNTTSPGKKKKKHEESN